MAGAAGTDAGSPEAALLAQYTALLQAVRSPAAAGATASGQVLAHQPMLKAVHPLSGILPHQVCLCARRARVVRHVGVHVVASRFKSRYSRAVLSFCHAVESCTL